MEKINKKLKRDTVKKSPLLVPIYVSVENRLKDHFLYDISNIYIISLDDFAEWYCEEHALPMSIYKSLLARAIMKRQIKRYVSILEKLFFGDCYYDLKRHLYQKSRNEEALNMEEEDGEAVFDASKNEDEELFSLRMVEEMEETVRYRKKIAVSRRVRKYMRENNVFVELALKLSDTEFLHDKFEMNIYHLLYRDEKDQDVDVEKGTMKEGECPSFEDVKNMMHVEHQFLNFDSLGGKSDTDANIRVIHDKIKSWRKEKSKLFFMPEHITDHLIADLHLPEPFRQIINCAIYEEIWNKVEMIVKEFTKRISPIDIELIMNDDMEAGNEKQSDVKDDSKTTHTSYSYHDENNTSRNVDSSQIHEEFDSFADIQKDQMNIHSFKKILKQIGKGSSSLENEDVFSHNPSDMQDTSLSINSFGTRSDANLNESYASSKAKLEHEDEHEQKERKDQQEVISEDSVLRNPEKNNEWAPRVLLIDRHIYDRMYHKYIQRKKRKQALRKIHKKK